MIKIAYVNASMPVNGVSTVIMNYCRYLNKNRFNIEILTGKPIDEIYINECSKLRIKINELPPKRGSNPLKYYWEIYKCFKKNKYDIVHVHGNSATVTVELFIAMILGIKVRIAHCHNTQCDKKIAHFFLKPILSKIANVRYACSVEAGKWMFGNKKFDVMPNGFHVKKFKFSEKERKKVREKLGLSNKYVIGHVGMFNYQKNHEYILKIFEKVGGKIPESVLLLVGTGPNYEKIKNMINKHKYSDRIICHGVSNNVYKLYSAMDAFLFPSRYEGLGIVLLEAQISGLPCAASDVVPREVKIVKDNFEFIPLYNDEEWINIIIDYYKNKNRFNRQNVFVDNKENIDKYNIIKNTIDLEEKYINYTSGMRYK